MRRHGIHWPFAMLPAIVAGLLVGGLPSIAEAKADIGAAKKEGKVIFYTSMDSKTANKLGELFTAKYGIPVDVYRSGTGKVLAKIEAEFAAGKNLWDVVQVSDIAPFLVWKKEGKTAAYKPAEYDMFFDFMKDPDGYWVAVKSNTSLIAYNTNLIKKEEAPKSWKDLTDPKYKDKISMSNPYYAGTTAVNVAVILELYGWDFYVALAKNRPFIADSHGNLETMMIAGERPLIAEQNNYSVLPDKYKGQPVEVVYPTEGVTLSLGPAAILKEAPHPNAARLFMDFLSTKEAGEIFAQEYYYSGRTDVPAIGQPQLTEIKFHLPKFAWMVENKQMLVDKWDRIMGRK